MITRRNLLLAAPALIIPRSVSAARKYNSGIDPRLVDWSQRPMVRSGGDLTTVAGRSQVLAASLPNGTVQIIFDGQSNNSNSVNGSSGLSLTNIYNMSITTRGIIFSALEPLMSCDLVQFHHGINLARSIIDDGFAPAVVLTLDVFGGSYCADHAPGGGVVGGLLAGTVTGDGAWRVGLCARAVYNAGLWNMKTIIDLQLGEWDSDNVATTQANFTAALNGVIAEYKRVGLLRTGNVMFIHQNSRIAETAPNRANVRNPQASIPDGILVRAGADIDTIPVGAANANRYDGTHFTATGAALQSALKKPILENFILNG